MPMLVAITVYDVEEACELLADLTGKPKRYSRQRLDYLVRNRIRVPLKSGRQYLITKEELDWLAKQLQIKKRSKTIDK